jgi:2,3-bisphosphoglycerate-dependent phosphoglycerate mutase
MGLDAAGLAAKWNEAKAAGKLVKFSGGFYCAELDGPKGKVYVLNGFFMEMRNKFVKPGASIYYFVVDWDPMLLPWVDFRGKILGATDPTQAPETSVRGLIYKDWQNLGLSSQPNMGDNGVHGSASPVEALFERMNWLGTKLDKDPFGKLLVRGGVTPAQVDEWSKDPQIYYGIGSGKGSLYDDLEDVDTDVALEECLEIARTGHTPNQIHNTALVFIKPHAVTDATKALAKQHLLDAGITILKEGFINNDTIDKDMLIDKHYYAIASKATLLTPDQLPVPADKFQKKFDLDWQTVLASGKAVNAKQACEKLGVDAAGLGAKWLEAKKADLLVKFGGGFYCGKVGDLYVFNGFFMEMRNKYVAPGAGIYYFLAEWDPLDLAWSDFRGNVLGPTDPTAAPEGSLRGKIYKGWKELGLASEPNVGDNGVHASASPFEGLAERMNWLGVKVENDQFAGMLIAGGATTEDIQKWVLDPQVTYESHHKSVTKSLYDTLEDVDADRCVLLTEIIIGNRELKPKAPVGPKAGDPTPGVYKVVFVRHGESDWNVKNIFTGWHDVDLSPAGMQEAVAAGLMLKDNNFKFDIVFTSVLRRAIKTAWTALMGSENYAMPVIKSWRLNERHYGGLQGLNKAETAAKHGDAQVKIWRRSYDVPPPEIDMTDSRHPSNDPLYKNVPKAALPGAESLKLTVDRVLPFWFDAIAPCVMAGRSVLVAAHGNSLRAICKYIEGMSEAEVLEFNIPTGVPLVYELDGDLKFIRKYYLMDEEAVKKKIAGVANQGKAK